MMQDVNWIERNAIIHISLIIITFFLVTGYSWWFLLIYPAFLALSDLFYYYFQTAIFDPEIGIQKGYQVSCAFNDTLYSEGIDYGFNFYNGNYKKSRHQAQIDKFEYAIEKLQLKPGMSLIDIGCGCGDWIHYLKEKGINVTGVNITYEQVAVCKKRGLDVVWANWKEIDNRKDLKKRLYHKYDAVTFWDTVEHYVPMKDRNNSAAQNQIYKNMFALAQNLIDPHSISQRVFISCLHMRHEVAKHDFGWQKIKKLYYCYLLDKFHSGCYPSGETDQLVANAENEFELVGRLDTTLDYYMTSILEPSHFGVHQFKWNLKRVLFAFYVVFSDPHWFQRILWYYSSNWMCQFNADNIQESDMIHWWLVFKSRQASKEKF